jgi:sugar/nucleoside kinase (ribokinase family)
VAQLGLVGNLSHDRVGGAPPRLGGGVFYGARALTLLGRPVQVVARGETLEPFPVAATVLPARETTAFSFRYEGDRRVMEVDAVGEPWTVENAAAVEPGVEWLHVAALLRSDFCAETLAALAPGRTLSLDGQGLARVRALGPLRLDRDFDPAVLERVSILKLSENEAETLGGIGALERLGVPEIVVTLGRHGSLVLAAGEVHELSSQPVRTADPTGAGDAFAVGYLAARSEGSDPPEAASAAGELVARFLS